MALPEHLQIDGEYQRAAFRGGGTLNQRAHKAAVLHDIELEAERFVHRGSHVLDRANRKRAHREWNPRSMCSTTGQDLAVAMLQARHGDRSQSERQRYRLAEH